MKIPEWNLALCTGIFILLMAVVAGYTYGYVYNSLIEKGHSVDTIRNIQSSKTLFISGTAGWLIIFILDLLVSWSAYKLFQRISHSLSLTTAIARLVYTLFLGVAIFHLIKVIPLVQVHANEAIILSHLASFESVWSLGLIVFGLHLTGLGILSLKSRPIPGLVGWLLILAGFSYTGIHIIKAFLPDPGLPFLKIETILSIPMAIGELAFALWLVIKGRKRKIFTL